MTPPDPARVAEVAEGLSLMERKLFMGEAEGWGSWMFSVGGDLVCKGVARRFEDSIYFDTPLGLAVREYLRSQPNA